MMEKRFWEIDFLRGIAIVMMVVFHTMWDINYFYSTSIPLSKGFWKIFQILTASIFLFLVGVSFSISSIQKDAPFLKYLKRGLRIFGFGLVITLITWFVVPDGFVFFGILHLIGFSIILSWLFRKFNVINILFGFVVIVIGVFFQGLNAQNNLLAFLGYHASGLYSVDYFPIFPWFGIVLFGIYIGKVAYHGGRRNFNMPWQNNGCFFEFFQFLGRNSLMIYLFHQIILFSLFLISSVLIKLII